MAMLFFAAAVAMRLREIVARHREHPAEWQKAVQRFCASCAGCLGSAFVLRWATGMAAFSKGFEVAAIAAAATCVLAMLQTSAFLCAVVRIRCGSGKDPS